MKQTIFFDLGNVLIFFSHQKMCRQIASAYETSPEMIYDVYFKNKMAEHYELGEVTSDELHAHLNRTFKKEVNFLELMQAASSIFEPNLELFPLVKKLKEQGSRLILLSNTCEAHFNYAYSHFPVLKLFDDFLLSYELKMQKPEPRIFHKALALAHGNPCIYIDDLGENIKAAKKVGLSGIRYTSPGSLEAHLTKRGFLT